MKEEEEEEEIKSLNSMQQQPFKALIFVFLPSRSNNLVSGLSLSTTSPSLLFVVACCAAVHCPLRPPPCI